MKKTRKKIMNSHKREIHLRLCFSFCCLCLIFTGIGTKAAQAAAPDKNTLHAYSAVLFDGEAGRVLYEKNGYEVLPMASTTKIITLLVVLEHTGPLDIVTVSSNAAKQPDVQLNMTAGEQYYVKDLCYSLMLESHNDTAVALAEHVGGSVEDFAELMNAKANALGAYSANFVTPNGLDAEGHGISAADLAKIAAYAIKKEEVVKLITTSSHTFFEITKGRTFTVSNKNAFLTMMDGAIGVKTGYTGKAGYCFVGAVKRDDRLLISVVLASGWPPHKTYKWNDTLALMNYGINDFKHKMLLNENAQYPVLPDLRVEKGQKASVSLCYDERKISELKKRTLLLADTDTITLTTELQKSSIPAPVAAGEVVGELVIKVNDTCIEKIPVQTAEAVAPVNYTYYLKQTLETFFGGTPFTVLQRLLP